MAIRSVLALAILVMAFPANVYADYVFAPALTVSAPNLTSGGEETDLSSLEAKFGYTFDYGVYLGALFAMAKENGPTKGVGNESSSAVFGPSLGFNRWNTYAIATYHIFGERDLDAGGVKYSNAAGIQFDVGYVFSITETVSLGPQVTYRDIRFNEKQVRSLSETDTFQWTGIAPYISLWLNFN